MGVGNGVGDGGDWEWKGMGRWHTGLQEGGEQGRGWTVRGMGVQLGGLWPLWGSRQRAWELDCAVQQLISRARATTLTSVLWNILLRLPAAAAAACCP